MSACGCELIEPNNSTRWAECKSLLSFLDSVKAIRLIMRVWIFLILAGFCLAERERNDRSNYIAFLDKLEWAVPRIGLTFLKNSIVTSIFVLLSWPPNFSRMWAEFWSQSSWLQLLYNETSLLIKKRLYFHLLQVSLLFSVLFVFGGTV